MEVTATEAKNRLGQMLEHAQREPVFIEKSGRRHSVLLSAEMYDALVAARQGSARKAARDPGREFYAKYKDWVDMQNELVAKHGIFGEEFRPW
ncbi:MAG: type II toxin-antitoxin system prevent-host-death family antitoxin [Rubrivivax sp.]